jgi:hypothetical protein
MTDGYRKFDRLCCIRTFVRQEHMGVGVLASIRFHLSYSNSTTETPIPLHKDRVFNVLCQWLSLQCDLVITSIIKI